MTDDIVLDTNVLAHGSNPESGFFECASELLEKIAHGTKVLAVDEEFFANEAINSSRIYSEYLTHLNGCSLAQTVISTLIDEGRIKDYSTTVDDRSRGIINQGVPDPTDRKFVRVALNTDNKLLVSNDIRDFYPKFRATASKKLGVIILTSTEALNAI